MINPVSMNPDQIAAVGKTSLRKYKQPPLVYRCYCENVLHCSGRVLDYGCGRNPVHVPVHKGMELARYDICYFPIRPMGEFDVILVSNVLNVLPNRESVVQTVGDIAGLLKPDGWVFVNFPSSPRKGRMPDGTVIGHDWIETLLKLAFGEVRRVQEFGTKSSPVFICTK
jgi:SAM-dependent methyltransferase